MLIDHASAVAAPKSDPVFLHVKTGMTVIVTDTEGAWRMADVIWVDGGARNPKVPTLLTALAASQLKHSLQRSTTEPDPAEGLNCYR